MARHREPALASLLRRRAQEAPATVAFVVDGGAPLRYAEWERRSNAGARGLRERGVGAGDRVVLWFDGSRWDDLAVAYAAVHKRGAIPVPLGSWARSPEVAKVAAHSTASLVVAQASWDQVESGHDGDPQADLAAPSELAEVSYRCGYLSRPEARPRPIDAVLSELAAKDGARPAASVIHSFAPGTPTATEALWFPLTRRRGPAVVVPAFDPRRFCALAVEHGVERWSLAPSLACWMLESGALDDHDLSSVVQVVLDGGRPAAEVLSRLADRLPGASVVSVLGPAAARAAYVFEPGRPGSVGRPIGEATVPGAPGGGSGPVQVDDHTVAPGYTDDGFLYLAHRAEVVPQAGAGPPGPEPRGEVEETIGAIWARVLHRAGVGAHEDFFALGGDDLAAVEARSLVADALDVRLPAWAVREAPTVSAMAAVVERARRSPETGTPRPVPLAASQEGMVWHELFAPGSQNLPPLVRRYRGPLDAALFEKALDGIVRRHEPLRTTFELREGRPVQVVSPPSPLSLPVRDLAGLSAAEQDDALAGVLADAGRPFDLVEGPLFQPTLLRLGAEDHVAVFRVHHSVYDDWSVSVFRGELSGSYTALAAGGQPAGAELPVSFSTFARRQHRRLAGPAGTAQLRWWRNTLAGGPLGLELPIDDPDRPEGSAQPSAEPVSVDLSPELSAHLRALAGRQRVTPFMTVLSAFAVLLHRYTGHTDLLLASVVANRNRTELEGMIGCFTKKILVRLAMAADDAFADVLAPTRATLLGALTNQDLPFETVLQEALGAPAAAHGVVPSPVVMVQGVTPQARDVVLPGIATSGFDTSATTRRAHFAGGGEARPEARPWGAGLYRGTFLILSVVEHDDHLSLSARGAFHRAAVERLVANFRTLLADAVAHPFRPLSELALVDPAERAVVGAASGPGLVDPPDTCLHRRFDDQVAGAPSRVAVHGPTGVATFAQLGARADELARHLRARGVGPGTLVGLCLPPSLDCVVAVLAVWKAGAAYVGLDPDDGDGRLAGVLDDASAAVVLAPPGWRHPALAGRDVVDVGAVDAGPDPSPADRTPDPPPSAPALAFYGAGASAVPVGVVLSHRAVAGLLAGLHRDVFPLERPGLRVALSARPTEDGFLRQLVALLDGHTLHVGSPERLGSPGLDVVECAPEQLETLGDDPEGPVVVVGSRQPTRSPVGGPTVRHLWGPPGCCFGAALVTAGPGGRALLRPLAGLAASVLDASGRAVPVGVAGELHLSGPSWSEPARVVARPRPDGALELVGRSSDLLRLRGFTLDRARLEAALARCPGVREVHVNVEGTGGEDERLVAHVVPAGGTPPTLADLQLQVWSELPGYAWPSALHLDEPAVDGLPEATFLSALWAEVLGVERVPADANYWQRFSFLEVVTRARRLGVRLRDEQLTRNRTIKTLAADMASAALRATRNAP